jgi:hypothetical protein
VHLLRFLLNKYLDKPKLVIVFNFKHLQFNYFLGLVFYNDLFVPTHCRRGGLWLRVMTHNDTHTHTHTHTHSLGRTSPLDEGSVLHRVFYEGVLISP